MIRCRECAKWIPFEEWSLARWVSATPNSERRVTCEDCQVKTRRAQFTRDAEVTA